MRIVGALALTLGWGAAAEPPGGPPWPLDRFSVAADSAAIIEFLRAIRPDGPGGKQFASLVAQLGDEAFARREEAGRAILAAKVYYPAMLREAARSDDPEIQMRAAQLLKQIGGASGGESYERVLCAVFDAVAARKMPGLIGAIFEAADTSDDFASLWAAGRALRSTAARDDDATLRAAIASKSARTRAAAARGFAAAAKDNAAADLRELAKDSDARVRLQAAFALADMKDRDCLSPLVILLETEDPDVRARACAALKALAGSDMGYEPLATAASRAEKLKAWRAWLTDAANKATLKWDIPDRAFTPRPGLVLWNRLGSQTEIENSEVGPGGAWTGKGAFAEGLFGKCMELTVETQLAVTFPSDILSVEAGCIEVWAQLKGFPADLPDGQRPAFFVVADGHYVIYLNGNDGCGRGGLCANAGPAGGCGTGGCGGWTYERVLGKGKAADWHHYALVWNTKGIPAVADGRSTVAIFLDGKLHASGTSARPAAPGPIKGGPISLSRVQFAPGTVRLDNLKAWNFAKTDFADRFDADELEPLDKGQIPDARRAD